MNRLFRHARVIFKHAFSRRNGIRCALRGHHDPGRHFLGGYWCRACGLTGADLDDMGTMDGGSVTKVRRVYSRDNGGMLTRTDAWEANTKGEW